MHISLLHGLISWPTACVEIIALLSLVLEDTVACLIDDRSEFHLVAWGRFNEDGWVGLTELLLYQVHPHLDAADG